MHPVTPVNSFRLLVPVYEHVWPASPSIVNAPLERNGVVVFTKRSSPRPVRIWSPSTVVFAFVAEASRSTVAPLRVAESSSMLAVSPRSVESIPSASVPSSVSAALKATSWALTVTPLSSLIDSVLTVRSMLGAMKSPLNSVLSRAGAAVDRERARARDHEVVHLEVVRAEQGVGVLDLDAVAGRPAGRSDRAVGVRQHRERVALRDRTPVGVLAAVDRHACAGDVHRLEARVGDRRSVDDEGAGLRSVRRRHHGVRVAGEHERVVSASAAVDDC